jgi:hypothetical protein
MTVEFAIVGLGSWGLSALERTVQRARQVRRPVRVHLVQPGAVGGGVYGQGQPDYLVLNNPCGQLSLYAAPRPATEPEPAYAVGLLDWVVRRGYRWEGYRCVLGGRGRPISAEDFLPRRVMGEYLTWFYRQLVVHAPPNLTIVHHDAQALDIVARPDGRETVKLSDGATVTVDHVLLTSGHTWNQESTGSTAIRMHRPYPVEYLEEIAPPAARVAIAGMGLVGYDLITALTVGRAGEFSERGGRMAYRPSGREPVIDIYSRSGTPYCAKPVSGIDPTGGYRPLVCTPSGIASIKEGAARRGTGVDFRRELLPLILAEMQVRYHLHSVERADGSLAAADTRSRLDGAWERATFGEEVAALEKAHGRFEPRDCLFPDLGDRLRSSADYQSALYEMVADDLDEAIMPGGSPVKAAEEVTRILRDDMRAIIEFRGLSLASYRDFQLNVRGRINRLEAGPPAFRSQQLLALMDAGVVRAPYGPDPEVSSAPGGRVTIASTQLDQGHAATVEAVVRGHLDMPSLGRSASPLLCRLYETGRLTQLDYDGTPVGSVAIDREFHPFDANGRVQRHLSLLGVLTEGVRYFTHYLPSPQSRLRAVLDAEACIRSVIG